LGDGGQVAGRAAVVAQAKRGAGSGRAGRRHPVLAPGGAIREGQGGGQDTGSDSRQAHERTSSTDLRIPPRAPALAAAGGRSPRAGERGGRSAYAIASAAPG